MGSCTCTEQTQTPASASNDVLLSPTRHHNEAEISFISRDFSLAVDINRGLQVYLTRKSLSKPRNTADEHPIPAQIDPKSLLSRSVRKVLTRLPAFTYDQSTVPPHFETPQQLPDGSIYIGEWDKNSTLWSRNGAGQLYKQDGGLIEGYWKNGVLEGVGREIEANGDYYEGGFERNKRHGAGTFAAFEGVNTYSGGWEMGVKHGFGQENLEGVVYEGPFVHGEKTGNGRLLLIDGEYIGTIVNGQPEGEGTWLTSDGCYKGTWRAGKLEGRVDWVDDDGVLTRCEFRNGQKIREID